MFVVLHHSQWCLPREDTHLKLFGFLLFVGSVRFPKGAAKGLKFVASSHEGLRRYETWLLDKCAASPDVSVMNTAGSGRHIV